jgi:hypothetical protein
MTTREASELRSTLEEARVVPLWLETGARLWIYFRNKLQTALISQ